MIRKSIVYTILVSMTLHCGCRLGFIDHLYNKRNEIAYAIGLIAEIPIALCGSKYQHHRTFKIEVNTSAHTVPPMLIKAEQINLFFVSEYSHSNSEMVLPDNSQPAHIKNLYQLLLVKPIFHPPAEIA
jgi:hypothetical protein